MFCSCLGSSCLPQAVSLAVSSAQHQNATNDSPPGCASPPNGGVGVGGLSVEDISSALRQHADPTGLEQEGPGADAAEAVTIETPAVATTPSATVSVEAPQAESTDAVSSSEPTPAGVDKDSALSESFKSLGDRDAALTSSGFGASPVKEKRKDKEQKKTKTHGSEPGPWAFAAAAADSEHSAGARVGTGMVREFRRVCSMRPNLHWRNSAMSQRVKFQQFL